MPDTFIGGSIGVTALPGTHRDEVARARARSRTTSAGGVPDPSDCHQSARTIALSPAQIVRRWGETDTPIGDRPADSRGDLITCSARSTSTSRGFVHRHEAGQRRAAGKGRKQQQDDDERQGHRRAPARPRAPRTHRRRPADRVTAFRRRPAPRPADRHRGARPRRRARTPAGDPDRARDSEG